MLVLYSGSNGADLTAKLQTAAAATIDSNLWPQITSASATLGTSAVLLDARCSLSQPPMGLLRLVLSHAGGSTSQGAVRVLFLLKEA